jgi:transposase-like protein
MLKLFPTAAAKQYGRCPECDSERIHKKGMTCAGSQRLQCAGCGKRWSSSGLKGRPSIFDRPLTKAEQSIRRKKIKVAREKLRSKPDSD